MKKTVLFLFISVALGGFAQSVPTDSLPPDFWYKINDMAERLEDMQEPSRYKIYYTANSFNQLKLDTRTGQIWQLQWNFRVGNERTWEINGQDLSVEGSSFRLYPTEKSFYFILLDKHTGRTWLVEWDYKKTKHPIREFH